MKLSTNTINLLKNFASINPNLVVNAGSVLKTVAVTKSIMALAKVEESFPVDFAIYDLSEFLGVLSLFKDPDLQFNKDNVVLVEGRNRVKYMYGDKDTFKVVPPEKTISLPSKDISFTLKHADFQSLMKASSVLKLGEIAATNQNTEDGGLAMKVYDMKNPLTNNFAVGIEDSSYKGDFTMIAKVENLRLIPGDYEVTMSSKRIAQFKNTELDVEYFVALESNSEYN